MKSFFYFYLFEAKLRCFYSFFGLCLCCFLGVLKRDVIFFFIIQPLKLGELFGNWSMGFSIPSDVFFSIFLIVSFFSISFCLPFFLFQLICFCSSCVTIVFLFLYLFLFLFSVVSIIVVFYFSFYYIFPLSWLFFFHYSQSNCLVSYEFFPFIYEYFQSCVFLSSFLLVSSQFPILLVFCIHLQLVSPYFLFFCRKFFYFFLCCAICLVTPPDVVVFISCFFVFFFLYEIFLILICILSVCFKKFTNEF